MQISKLLLSTLVLLGATSACKPRAYNSSSGVKHNAGDYLPQTMGEHWFHPSNFENAVKSELVPALALQYGASPDLVQKVKLLRYSHEAVTALQAVVDSFDTIVRSRVREIDQSTGSNLGATVSSIPKPRVVVWQNPEVNAAVYPLTVDDKQLVFPAIVINTGLIEHAANEGAIVSVVAHELAHYYKAHPALLSNYPEYFYIVSQNGLSSKPRPDASLKDVGERLKKASESLKIPLSPEQQYHTAFIWSFMWKVGDSIKTHCSQVRCEPACEQFIPAVETQNQIFSEDNWDSTSASFARIYIPFESSLSRCAQTLKLGATPGSFAPAALTEIIPNEWASLATAATGKSLHEYFLQLSAGVQGVQEKQVASVLVEGVQKRIGLYTYEQEADELAAELVSLRGADPRILVQARLNMLKAKGPWVKDERLEFGYEKCNALYQQNWKINSSPVFVPVGLYSEPHHSNCYRAYVLDHEIRGHGYAFPSNPPSLLPLFELKNALTRILPADLI
jgi:hypothetical protein